MMKLISPLKETLDRSMDDLGFYLLKSDITNIVLSK